MERSVETALGSAGDFAGAALWRSACRDLGSGLRIAVIGTDPDATARLGKRVRDAGRGTALVLPLDPAQADGLLAVEEALVGAHAAVWATPVTAALGETERDAMARVGRLVPFERAVVIADRHVLDRLSDDPEGEWGQIRARLAVVVPPGWAVVDPTDLDGWIADLDRRRDGLTRDRRVAVARVLLDDARERTAASLAESVSAVDRAEALLGEEDAALDEARRHGERIAAHVLGTVQSHTESLLVDLRAFLSTLENELPSEVAAVDDVVTVRRALPHWLDHVVDGFVTRRLDAWRVGVLADLGEVRIPEEDARRAALWPPALHPAPLRANGGWARRLAVTAALGGGAALALAGLVVPGVFLASVGLAGSALTREDPDAPRERLIASARAACRRMADDADRLLREQLAQIEAELKTLGDREARAADEARQALRARLVEERAWHRNRARELRQVLDALAVRVEAFGRPESA